MIKKINVIVVVLMMLGLCTPIAFAKEQVEGPTNFLNSPITVIGQLVNPTQGTGLVFTIIRWVYSLLYVAAFFMLLMAAYNYVFDGGEEKKVKIAKKQVQYAVTAIVIAMLANGIIFLVRSIISS